MTIRHSCSPSAFDLRRAGLSPPSSACGRALGIRSSSVAIALALLSLAGVVACSSDEGADGAGGSGGDGGSGASPATTTTTGAGGATSTGTGGATSSGGGAGAGGAGTGGAAAGDPPFGGSSNGTGGPVPANPAVQQAGNVTYRLLVDGSYGGAPTPLLVVYSGTEGGANMTSNLQQVASFTNTDGFIRAILDGVDYYGDGAAGAAVLDDVRAKYNVDNDRTYLLGESAGTSAALQLGFHLRQSYFAAYWANDVNATDTPGQNAAALGFAPWGQVGPGGQFALAQQIVSGMAAAGYQLPNPAPYAGTGADTHGDPQQFIAAVSWFPGKARQ